MCIRDRNNGWAVGDGGSILRSTDGGENWVSKTSVTTSDLNSVHFYDICLLYTSPSPRDRTRSRMPSSAWKKKKTDKKKKKKIYSKQK